MAVVGAADTNVAGTEFAKLPGPNSMQGEAATHMLSEVARAEDHMKLDIPLDWLVAGPTGNIDHIPVAAGTVRD